MAENAVNTEQGVILEALNYKADLDGSNVAGTGFEDYIKSLAGSSGGDGDVYIIDSYVNGDSGYTVWSNGICEQWGTMLGEHTLAGKTFVFEFFKPVEFMTFELYVKQWYTPKSQYVAESTKYYRKADFESNGTTYTTSLTTNNYTVICASTVTIKATDFYWYCKGHIQ